MDANDKSYESHFRGICTIAVWATAFPFGKVALQSVDALTLSVARVVGGAILMLIIGVFKGLHIPTSWREWGLYILLGATGTSFIKSFLMKDCEQYRPLHLVLLWL